MRTRLAALGVPVPRFRAVETIDDVTDFGRELTGGGCSKPFAAATTGGASSSPMI